MSHLFRIPWDQFLSGVKHVIFSTGLIVTWLVAIGPALGGATYNDTLSFSFTLPPALTNTFGYAGPVLNATNLIAPPVGNAGGSSAPAQLSGSNAAGYNVNGALESGFTGPPSGSEMGYSQGIVGVNLGNFTGSNPQSPPPMTLLEPFSFSLTYSIATTVANSPFDYASAKVHFDVILGGVTLYTYTNTITGNAMDAQMINMPFNLSLPANSVTPLAIDYYISGVAMSTMPPAPPPIPVPPPTPPPLPYPIPEPSSLALGAIGLAFLAGSRIIRNYRLRAGLRGSSVARDAGNGTGGNWAVTSG